MKKFLKEYEDLIAFVVVVYLTISFLVWLTRVSLEDVCKPRYVDYVFPITFLHCEIK